MSTAASSSATYGFSASLELDIDVLEKQFEAYKEQSVASNINANNININAENTATVRGSNLQASHAINIAAKDTNILASQDVNNSSNSMDHKHLNISYGTAGGGVSASADSSKGSSRGITNQNSQLVASNIHINTADTTTVAGANVSASDSLNIDTKHLNVSSVQDSSKSDNRSQGMSISASLDGDITGAGINAGNSRSRDKQTVLTTLTGNQVNIGVEKDTTIRGALIAAVDSQGNDNGNLTLKTDTLEVGSMNNTHSSKSMSMGLNVSVSNKENKKTGGTDSSISSVGIDYSNDRSNSKTKTLGTLGAGSIEVANVDGSNTRMLNRDINDNEIDIYDISSHKGLKGTVDTRMFTKKGRAEIAGEVIKAKVGFYDVAKDIINEEELTFLDAFSYQGYKVAFYDGMQTALNRWGQTRLI